MTCGDYRPDHNGECLNCDEPADAHLMSAEQFLAAEGFADSRPHSSVEIAALMERYAKGIAALCPNLLSELADYEASFDLYDKASRALMHAYKAAHPEFPQDAWPDATKVNVWAAARVLELEGQLTTMRERLVELMRAKLPDERAQELRAGEQATADLSLFADQIVNEPDRLCATCRHPAKNHTLGKCRKKRCGCGGWRG